MTAGTCSRSRGANAEAENYIVIQTEDFRTRLLLPEVLPQASVVEDDHSNPTVRCTPMCYTRPPGSLPAAPAAAPCADAALGRWIRLAGYDVQPADLHPGEMLYLQLHWLVQACRGEDWTVFTHLLRAIDSGSRRWPAPTVRPGGGSLPTPRWQPGWRVLDEYQIHCRLTWRLERIRWQSASTRMTAPACLRTALAFCWETCIIE